MVTSVPSPLLRYSLQRDNCSAESVVKVKAVVSHVVSHKTEGDFRGVCDFSRSREGAGGGEGGVNICQEDTIRPFICPCATYS